MVEFEMENVSGIDFPTTGHSPLLTLTTYPALSFLPISTTLPILCFRPQAPNLTLICFASPFIRLSIGGKGACRYVERG